MERRQTPFVADLLRDIPGFAVSRSGALGAQTQVRVRGSEANHVLVFVDGVEVNDPAIGDGFQFEHLMTSDIERVEITRGPQSALWGSDAVSGVINIVTRRPATSGEADGFLEAGAFDTARAGGHFGFAGNRSRIGLGLAYLDSDGTNISREGDENDGYTNATASLTADLDLNDAIRLDFFARRTASETQFDATDFIVTGLPTDADLSGDGSQNYFKVAAAIGDGGPRTHSLKLTYLDTNSDNLTGSVLTSSLAAEKLGFYYQSSFPIVGELADTLILALDHENEKFIQSGAASPFGDPNQEQELSSNGAVVEYRVSPTEALNLSVSGRRDQNSDFKDATSYRLTASYALGDGSTRLRGSYGTGQKSPTFIDRFGFFPDVFLGNPNLQPERSTGWELGVDRTFPGAGLTVSATYFDDVLEDEINGFVFDPVLMQSTAANELGKSHRQGLEMQLTARPTDVLAFNASYTYVDSTQSDGASNQVDEIRRPRHMASANINYTFSARASINLNFSYNGTQYDTFFPPFPQAAEQRKLSSYRLVSLSGSFRLTGALELFGRIENLLDEEYEDVLGFATSGIGAYAGIRMRRR
jgi:vitamin B12 transporter